MARLNLCFILVITMIYCTLAEEKYSNKYDNFDIDKVLNNDRILTSYIKCLMEEGNCTNEGRDLKSKSILYFIYTAYLFLNCKLQ